MKQELDKLERSKLDILDILLDGDFPLPHLLENLKRSEASPSQSFDDIAHMYENGLLDLFTRKNMINFDGCQVLDKGLSFNEALELIICHQDNPLFGVDLTEAGKQLITEFNDRSKR